jgi:hypothetical protein
MELAGKYNMIRTPSVVAHQKMYPNQPTLQEGLQQIIDESLQTLKHPQSNEKQITQAMINLNEAQTDLISLNKLDANHWR